MTFQQVFDTVAVHLLTQNERASVDTALQSKCFLRTSDGKKCAIGVLIPDNEYSSSLEHCSLNDLIVLVPSLTPFSSDEWQRFLFKLLMLHDETFPHAWFEGLTLFADEWKLSSECLSPFRPVDKKSPSPS